MKTESLLAIGAIGIIAYFLLKSRNGDGLLGGGGGTGSWGDTPTVPTIVQPRQLEGQVPFYPGRTPGTRSYNFPHPIVQYTPTPPVGRRGFGTKRAHIHPVVYDLAQKGIYPTRRVLTNRSGR